MNKVLNNPVVKILSFVITTAVLIFVFDASFGQAIWIMMAVLFGGWLGTRLRNKKIEGKK